MIVSGLISILSYGDRKPILHHNTTEDGLSHNEIRLIRKARNGMLWLGTQNGLSSFDGYRFTVYKSDRNNPNSICSDKIYALEASTTGNIWVGTTVGLCKLDPATGISQLFPDTFAIKNNLANSFINYLLEDRSGYLWIASNSGNYKYSVYHKTLEKILPNHRIKNFYESREGIFWLCHDGVISKYDRDSDKVLQTYPYTINQVFTDSFGVLWGAGTDGLYRYMPGQIDFEKIVHVKSPVNGGFNSISEDKDGRIFLGAYGGGITIYDPLDHKVSYLLANPLDQSALSSSDIYDIFSDGSGVVWIGTQEGLDVYDWSRQRFRKWKFYPNNPDGLSNSFIQYIYRDRKDQLWLGTRDSGLDLLEENTGFENPAFKHFPPGKGKGELKGQYITGILEDSNERFWVASWGGGLNLKEPGADEWINFRHREKQGQSIVSNGVTSLLEDRRGRIWIGTVGGLSLLKQDEKGEYSFQNFRHDPGDSLSINGNQVFRIFEDSKGRIWLGINNGGLNLLHEGADGRIWFESFVSKPNDPESISNNEVFVVFEDSKKRLWAGTSLKGLNRVFEEIDEEGNSRFRFKSYQEEDGLSDNEINAILEDDFGYLWISTNRGISKFDPETESFVNYEEYDGVLKGKFRKNAAWKDKDGTMYFGGAAGVNVFNPTHFKTNEIPPAPVITGVFIDGDQYLENDSLEGKLLLHRDAAGTLTLSLPVEFNRFEVQFSAMSFTSPRRNQYKWKLNKVDTNWHFYEGVDPRLMYNALEGGQYELVIHAANNDGIWSNKPAILNVRVHSKSKGQLVWLFTTILFFLLSIVLIIRIRKKQKKTVRKKTPISASDDNKRMIEQLNLIMLGKQLYLDSKLGLNDLADEIDITPNQLSALLNDMIGKSFYDYVNEYRIEEVKRRLVDPNQKKKILAVAWECGFNSKSAFNRIFKAHTGLTPTEFQKKHTS